ncbi:MAG: Sterol 3-beta-glucosyltransferase [Vezdaea aestivalis]|nr:MAG: Sterol 3-beta-glucosyltransferase [Vezdaea aestivalis]
MAGDKEPRKNLGRKLLKKRRDHSQPPLELPERLQDGDDTQEDVTAPKGTNAQYMNQSVFSMIAAAGSKVDFNARFDEESSDSEEETHEGQTFAAENVNTGPTLETLPKSKLRSHRKKISEHKLLKSLPKLNLGTIKERNYMSQSTILPSTLHVSSSKIGVTPRDAPLMSQLIEAQAQLDPSSLSSQLQEVAQREDSIEDGEAQQYSALSRRLMEIFELEKPERVISEYPCWLLKSVLLQGYMYITSRHVCFYAYLPKKINVNAKSGYLSKRGKQNPKYNRYWFTLKGDVLSYYLDPSDIYFPSGNIDLRYSIQASLADPKERGKDSKDFTVTTHQRTYHFKADSSSSAKEWVRTLQKVIFRSHNEGDSVKISIPMANIIDIEDSPVLGFADTFKIRAVDNDDTYAVDEIMVEDSPAQHIPADLLHLDSASGGRGSPSQNSPSISRDQSPRQRLAPILKESVKATLSPTPLSPLSSGRNSPRPSSDIGRSSVDMPRRSFDIEGDRDRPSFDRGRRSGSRIRRGRVQRRASSKSPQSAVRNSSDSYVHSLGQEIDATPIIQSFTDASESPSQILDRSDVFKSPTIKMLQKSSTGNQANDETRRHSEDSRKPGPSATEIHIHPPSRSQTQTSSPKPKARPLSRLEGESDSDSNKGKLQESNSSPSLQDLVKAGAYPLQRAVGFAGYLKKNSKIVSNILANESMGYIEKVSGMWQGGRKHYDVGSALGREPWDDPEDDEEVIEHNDRFRAHFALANNEHLEASFFGYLNRVLPLYGKIYISNRSFCFRSLLPGTRTKMILPLRDIENVYKEKGFRFGYSGLVLVIRAYEELFFEFNAPGLRDDCAVTLLQNLETRKFMRESSHLTQEEKKSFEVAKAEHQMLLEARKLSHTRPDHKSYQADDAQHLSESAPVLFDDPRASIINFKPTESLRITCLTIGSRGDVQPYIALCKGFLREGHKPKIATHAEFEPWIRRHGIGFAPVDGDPAELMRICVENGMFTYSFLREASQKFRGWIDDLLASAWKACQNSDILIESPSAMAGIHIAEALEIPYFRAFTMPWTRTRAYPHAFAVPDHKMGGAYNYFTYIMFDNVFWKAISGQVNRWRRKELGIRNTTLDKMQPNKVPFLYNFSPSVVVPPLDYSDWIRVTGYWFLDEAADWKPPQELKDFIQNARRDKKKIVYVGFGSIVVSDPAALTKTVVESVEKADVRCILSKGWSDRLGSKETTEPEVALPKSIFTIKSAPHDWLFKQIDAAAHHGGAGTTGASLRAGIPTIIKPFFGDQFFFGSRVEDLGVGIYVKKLNVSLFSKALWEACNGERIIVKARYLGEQIRAEDGVETAIQAIYRDLEYAKTLIKKKGAPYEEGTDESEESWTFIGDDADPELTRKIAEWEPMARTSRGSRLLSGSVMSPPQGNFT